jgi:hypothetical protein
VFICDKQHFADLAAKGHKQEGKCIAAYILDPDGDKKRILEAVSSKLGLKLNIHTDVLCKTDLVGEKMGMKSDGHKFNEDWLRSIADCDMLVTDSFHGVCFALIFQRPFVAISNPSRGAARFTALLGMCGLSDRLIYSFADLQGKMESLFDIDWDSVQLQLDKEIERSRKWLKTAIEFKINKPKSTYDFLQEMRGELYFHLNNIVTFINQVNERFGLVDAFANGAAARLDSFDAWAAAAGQRFDGNDLSLAEMNMHIDNISRCIEDNNKLFSKLENAFGKSTSLIEAFEGRTSNAELELRNIAKLTHSLSSEILQLKDEMKRIYSSKSYLLGRMLTFLPRRIKAAFKHALKKENDR